MILLKSVLDSLIRVELGNLAIGKPEWSGSKFNYVQLIDCVSMASVELHRRFALKKEYVTVTPLAGRQHYPLLKAHAVSDTGLVDKFIQDSVSYPFDENIVKIDTVLDEFGGVVHINRADLGSDIRLEDYRTLFINDPTLFSKLTVICRGLPAPISLSNEAALDGYILDIPHTYLDALRCYAAGKVYSNRGAENATNNESAVFFAKFEQACTQIVQLGLNDVETMGNTRFSTRGFV